MGEVTSCTVKLKKVLCTNKKATTSMGDVTSQKLQTNTGKYTSK